MTDLLKTGAQWLADQQAAHAAHNVMYKRGAQSATLVAMAGRSEWELPDAGGPVMRAETRDFVIRVADLRLDGSAVTPQRGDLIDEPIGSVTVTFEVIAPGGMDEPPWRFTDEYGYAFRIHTKRIAET